MYVTAENMKKLAKQKDYGSILKRILKNIEYCALNSRTKYCLFFWKNSEIDLNSRKIIEELRKRGFRIECINNDASVNSVLKISWE